MNADRRQVRALLLAVVVCIALPAAAQKPKAPKSRAPQKKSLPRRIIEAFKPKPKDVSAMLPERFEWKVPRPPDPPTPDDRISIAAVGDVMLGSTFPDETGASLAPDDGAQLLSEVTPILRSADITFGNLEGPMVDSGATKKCPPRRQNCYAFRVPTRYGALLQAAGFSVMNLANNHAMDFGAEGRASSRATLDALRIQHTGEVGDVATFVVKDKKVAVIGFTTYPSAYNLLDLDVAKALVQRLAEEADIVVVSFHAGGEGAQFQHVTGKAEKFAGENRGDVRKFARAMVESGASLVIGHGPHVVRGMELYRGHLIAYSLGNFATYGTFNMDGPNGLSLILRAELGLDGEFLTGQVFPARQERPGGPHLDPDAAAVLPVVRSLSATDFKETAVGFGDDGTILGIANAPPEKKVVSPPRRGARKAKK